MSVPARVAAWLERAAGLRELRAQHRGVDPEVDSVLVALATAGAAWRTTHLVSSDPTTGRGTDQARQPEPEAVSALTTTQAAHLLGITDRGVRTAITTGRLRAQRIGDRWHIDREDLEHYRAGRAA
ncbi:helix-turn-helix domain-containing protein [Verrucosispora sp. NA02020]|uniref:helix-turn-helix domain-containing protein n=1 Tax=Verrucosispora sp. NA02020 TaxID=2742132 RepID=UPI003D744A6D